MAGLLRALKIAAVPHGFRSSGLRGSCRSRSVNGTSRVDSQKAVPVIHKDAFPDRSAFSAGSGNSDLGKQIIELSS